jgi:hypothetical protein
MSDERKPKGDSEVGYKKPPEHTRFKLGHCANPKGRGKGTRNEATVIREILSQRIKLPINGKVNPHPFQHLFHNLGSLHPVGEPSNTAQPFQRSFLARQCVGREES